MENEKINVENEEIVSEEETEIEVKPHKKGALEEEITNIAKKVKTTQEESAILTNLTADDFSDYINLSELFVDPSENEDISQDDLLVSTVKTTAKKINLADLKDKIVDKRNPLEKERDLKTALFGNKAAFQIVAAQSGYMAQVVPLVNKDIYNILYSNVSRYEYRKNLYQLVWSKIINMTGGRVSFDEWLKMTSIEDIETFYYGIYCATFQDDSQYTITCPKCKTENTFTVNHKNLLSVADQAEMKALINDINTADNTKESIAKLSLLNSNEAIQLSNSGLIFEIGTPSLNDALELLRTVPEETIDKDAANMTNMLYTKQALIPINGTDNYQTITNPLTILQIIDNLSVNDGIEFKDVVSERVANHRITYSIKNIVCPNAKCKEKLDDIPVKVEDLLFSVIFDKIQ